MAVGVEHPVVSEYLRRLDAASAELPAGRREELAAEIRGHVAEALAEAGRDDEATVRGVLDRLGEPEDIVAAEQDEPGFGGPVPGGPGSTVPAAPPAGSGMPSSEYPGQAASLWGPLEITAVLGLTVGAVVLPGVGPVIGLICAWLSDRWTRREKIVATIWTGLAAAAVVLAGLGLFVARTDTSVGTPAPVVVREQGVTVAPQPSEASVPSSSGTATP